MTEPEMKSPATERPPLAGLSKQLAYSFRGLIRTAYELRHLRLATGLLELLKLVGGEIWWDLDMRGLIEERRDNLPEATRWFEQAVKRSPSDPHPFMRLAFLYARQGRAAEALETTRGLRAMGPIPFGFAYGFGTFMAQADRHEDALEWFELPARDNDAAARMCVGHSLLNLGRAEEAAAVYRTLDAEGMHPSVRLRSCSGVAKAEADLGRQSEALELARDAVARLGNTVDDLDRDEAQEVIAWLESEVGELP